MLTCSLLMLCPSSTGMWSHIDTNGSKKMKLMYTVVRKVFGRKPNRHSVQCSPVLSYPSAGISCLNFPSAPLQVN